MDTNESYQSKMMRKVFDTTESDVTWQKDDEVRKRLEPRDRKAVELNYLLRCREVASAEVHRQMEALKGTLRKQSGGAALVYLDWWCGCWRGQTPAPLYMVSAAVKPAERNNHLLAQARVTFDGKEFPHPEDSVIGLTRLAFGMARQGIFPLPDDENKVKVLVGAVMKVAEKLQPTSPAIAADRAGQGASALLQPRADGVRRTTHPNRKCP